MHTRHALRLVALPLVLLLAGPAMATSIFVEGVIIEVKPDFSGYTVKGYDHYNHVRYADKITDIPVKIAGNCVFVLDNRIVRRELALAKGRAAYAIGSSGGAMLVVALSEPAGRTIGEVAGWDGNKLNLKVGIGADSYAATLDVEAQATYREGEKAATREAAAAVGKWVRVSPARKQTVLAFSDKAFENAVPPKTPLAANVAIKSAEGGNLTFVTAKGEAVEDLKLDAKRLPITFDVRGFPAHERPALTGIGPGSPAVAISFEKRPGKVDSYVVLQVPDEGRTEGNVKSFNAGSRELVVAVLTPTGLKDASLTLDADAACQLDGKTSPMAEALKPGVQVSVYSARPQTIQALPTPPVPEKKAPVPVKKADPEKPGKKDAADEK